MVARTVHPAVGPRRWQPKKLTAFERKAGWRYRVTATDIHRMRGSTGSGSGQGAVPRRAPPFVRRDGRPDTRSQGDRSAQLALRLLGGQSRLDARRKPRCRPRHVAMAPVPARQRRSGPSATCPYASPPTPIAASCGSMRPGLGKGVPCRPATADRPARAVGRGPWVLAQPQRNAKALPTASRSRVPDRWRGRLRSAAAGGRGPAGGIGAEGEISTDAAGGSRVLGNAPLQPIGRAASARCVLADGAGHLPGRGTPPGQPYHRHGSAMSPHCPNSGSETSTSCADEPLVEQRQRHGVRGAEGGRVAGTARPQCGSPERVSGC
ncbi:hypothetical protein STBA_40730 [Streptomyces sp. MP131-18]|nr:hypothetical protein STBA_40730 [Streptomyces sp. MP131-18]